MIDDWDGDGTSVVLGWMGCQVADYCGGFAYQILLGQMARNPTCDISEMV